MSQDLYPKNKPRLLDQVRNAIRTKHYSIRTEESYTRWIKQFILFHNKKHPDAMGEKEINAFLTHLAVNRRVSASTQMQALSALLFLYKEVLGQGNRHHRKYSACQKTETTQGCQDDHGIYPCVETRWTRDEKSGRSFVN